MSDPTTPEGRAELRNLLAKATDRPWIAEYSGPTGNCVIPHDAQSTLEAVAFTRLLPAWHDAELIAAAVNALPVLLDALDRQERELAGYRAEEQRVRAWNALVAEGNVRCTYCDLRYAEREEYPCGDARDQNSHHYDADELADARRRELGGDS